MILLLSCLCHVLLLFICRIFSFIIIFFIFLSFPFLFISSLFFFCLFFEIDNIDSKYNIGWLSSQWISKMMNFSHFFLLFANFEQLTLSGWSSVDEIWILLIKTEYLTSSRLIESEIGVNLTSTICFTKRWRFTFKTNLAFNESWNLKPTIKVTVT